MECSSTRYPLSGCKASESEKEFVTSTTAALQEEYLEMDYATEIEDCSRYTFSPQPQYEYTLHMDLYDCGPARGREQESGSDASSDDFNCVALSILFCEVRRRHLENLRRQSASAAAVATATSEWRGFARSLWRDFKQFGHVYVRRKFSAMLLFEPRAQLSLTDDGSARVHEFLDNKIRLLRQLRKRNQLFVDPTTTAAPCANASTAWCLSPCDGILATAADVESCLLRPLSVVAVKQLDADIEIEDEDAPQSSGLIELCNTSFQSITNSQKSGNGASSSGSSNGSDEGSEYYMCFGSPTMATDLSFLVNYA